MNGKDKLGIYIHIPFCERKCNYCGFLSFDDRGEKERSDYIFYLLKELELRGRELSGEFVCDSVFIGGGTPSIMREGQICKILNELSRHFDLSSDAEISIEGNPDSITREKLLEYRKAGINRLSIGVQSFQDDILRQLGRVHGRKAALGAYDKARTAGFDNINLDLMFGVPGQEFSCWIRDVEQVLFLSPEHISLYSLQLEEGSPFYSAYRRGELDIPGEDEDRKMFHHAVKRLKEAGYDHYEISNFGKKKCRHNLKYWSLEDYVGVGLGASSYLRRHRSRNASDLNEWREKIKRGILPIDREGVRSESRKETISVYAFTALRKTGGIDKKDFREKFGEDFGAHFKDQMNILEDYRRRGLLTMTEERVALTESGIDVSNHIMAEFV